MHEPDLKEIQKQWHGSLKTYCLGFIGSLILTACSFLLGWSGPKGSILVYSLIGLALVQAGVQVIFFLHLGKEEKPRWETLTFGFMALVVLIVVIGTLWIMYDLNERMMGGM